MSYPVPSARRYCMDERALRRDDAENPGVRGSIERTAQRLAALAVKFEGTRRRTNTGRA
jgi:hypothetical protein